MTDQGNVEFQTKIAGICRELKGEIKAAKASGRLKGRIVTEDGPANSIIVECESETDGVLVKLEFGDSAKR